jgi:hypothetical protein
MLTGEQQDTTLPTQPQALEARRQADRERQARYRTKVRSNPTLKKRWLKRHREEHARYRARQRSQYLLRDTPISTNKYTLPAGGRSLREVSEVVLRLLRDMAWSGHMPTMRRKAVELAIRNAGYLVKTMARRAIKHGRGGPGRLFAWFLQRIDQVAQQSWAWGCGGRDIVALPVGFGEVHWGRPKDIGAIIGLVMAKLAAMTKAENRPSWWRHPAWRPVENHSSCVDSMHRTCRLAATLLADPALAATLRATPQLTSPGHTQPCPCAPSLASSRPRRSLPNCAVSGHAAARHLRPDQTNPSTSRRE